MKIISYIEEHEKELLKMIAVAFEKKFKIALKEKHNVIDFLYDANFITFFNPKYIKLAVKDDIIVGFIIMSAKNDGAKHVERNSFLKMTKKYGISTLLKIKKIVKLLDPNLNDDDIYIELVYVSEKYRHKGIGTILLNESYKFVREGDNKVLKLSVIFENKMARKLYEREGFKILEHRESKQFKKLLGYDSEFLMIKIFN